MLLAHQAPGGDGYFAMMLIPPLGSGEAPRHAVEMIFVLDCSGSMGGVPLEQSKDAVRHALRLLGPQDTFQIIRFSDSSSAMGERPVAATPQRGCGAGDEDSHAGPSIVSRASVDAGTQRFTTRGPTEEP